jgi:hypothetical protein
MRIYLSGEGPRVDCLKLLLEPAGHEITPTTAAAEVWLCCQPPGFNGRKERHETQQLIAERCPGFTGPFTLCLVTMEPNDLWPANFCHICEGILRSNALHEWQVVRAHFRSPLPGRASELVLGGNTPAAENVLRAVFGPTNDAPAPLPIKRVFAAELAAEKATTSPR